MTENNKPTIAGLLLVPDFIDREQERRLLETVDNELWSSELKRRVQHYGYRYDYKSRAVRSECYLGPLPDWLAELAVGLVERGVMPEVPDQVIVNEYMPGQGIAAHVDCPPCFGEHIASLSLGSQCLMEFTSLDKAERGTVPLPGRSLLALRGAARYGWKHAIPPRQSDSIGGRRVPRGRRVSLTFRKVILAQGDGNLPSSC